MISDEFKKFEGAVPHKKGWLLFGERDGLLIGIGEVERGLACNCVCPNTLCRARLVARKGPHKADHFAHYKRQDCRVALESVLHKMAKHVLEEALEIFLPDYVAKVAGKSETIIEARMMQFDSAILERRTGRIVPDVTLIKGSHALLVEMVVTHWCDQEKIDLLKLDGLACLEIDLSTYKAVPSLAGLRDIVIREARRAWLNNPLGNKKATEMQAAANAKAATEAAKHEAQLQKIVQAITVSEAAARSDVDLESLPDFVARMGLKSLVNIALPGDFCFADRRTWQLSVLEKYVFENYNSGPFSTVFTTKDVHEHVKPLRIAGFPHWIPEANKAEVEERLPQYRSSYQVVQSFLEELRSHHVLEYRKGWRMTEAFLQSVRHTDWLDSERVRRREEIAELVREIFKTFSQSERKGFDYKTWLGKRPLSYLSIGEMIDSNLQDDEDDLEGNGTEYESLLKAVKGVHNMLLHNGPLVDNHVGLPIKGQVDRLRVDREYEAIEAESHRAFEAQEAARKLAEREQARLQEEKRAAAALKDAELLAARVRMVAFERMIRAAFPERFEEVASALHVEGTLAHSLAARDDHGLRLVEIYLANIAKIEHRSQAERLVYRRKSQNLLLLCGAAKDRDAANRFLNTWNPVYGARPLDTCFTPGAFSALRNIIYQF